MDDERAATYLRLQAEAQLRGALRPSDGGLDVGGRVQQVRWAGEILVAAGMLGPGTVARTAAELEVALAIRAGMDARRSARKLDWMLGQLDQLQQNRERVGQRRYYGAAWPIRIVPLGRTLRIRTERAPCDLQLMTLVGTPAEAAITAAVRMHWPGDGSSADLEIAGAGVQHLPYDQLWAADDQGTRYGLQFGGDGGTAAWHGLILLSRAPPPQASWLDLIADGRQRLTRLDLRPRATGAAGAAAPASLAHATTEKIALVRPGERLLDAEAGRIMASAWDTRGPAADPRLGEMTRILADAGALAAGSGTPGQLAALCERLGAKGHGLTAAPAAELPGPWASVLTQRAAAPAADGQDVFAPLGAVLPDIEGTRFALAGLASAAGESYLHVVASGLPELAGVSARGWNCGFGWWLRDDAGHWHVAVDDEESLRSLGEAAAFRLRLTPPLAAPPDTIEVVVTGHGARVRAIVPVRVRDT